MHNPPGETHKNFAEQSYRKRFRNQATGIGQTRKASEETGAKRSQCVANAIPSTPPGAVSQLETRDRSYPAPNGGATDCSTTVACRETRGLPLRNY